MAIILLDAKTINRIAAGEVIERPASVVKELVENAIDAGSTEIEIRIESGGRNLVAVVDNGHGVEKGDVELAFMRHATSKLSDNDLIEIRHLGFRGEALPSIAAVSKIKLSSKANGANEAWSISYEGGEKTKELAPYSISQGTHIEVCDLFFSTPNRLKFLKTERAEMQHIVDIINNLAMINYDIGFTLTSNNKKLLKYAKQASLFSRLCKIEKEFHDNSLEVCEEEGGTKLTGYICKPTVNRGKSSMIYTFVNKRPIRDNLLVGAIKYAYHDLIPNNRYPFAVLHLEIPYDQVDVNVHPNKSEVRFQNKKLIYEIVTRGLIKALSRRIRPEAINENEERDNAELIDSAREDEHQRMHLRGVPTTEAPLAIDFQNRSDERGSKEKHQENCELKKEGKNKEGNRDFYEKRPSSVENSLMKKFGSMQKFPEALEKQVKLIEDHPLGHARCQVYNTYIIAENKNKLVIVDQHAAHERLVYEYMKEVMEKSAIKRQSLLIPEKVEITNQAGMEMIENYQDKLSEMGFGIEVTSNSTVLVKEIPAILNCIDIKEVITDIADRLIEMEDTLPIEDKINKILATISCHNSIRAGREMKLEEMNALLRQMEDTPYSDHGRPTYIEMKLSDIEKLFERK
ncbi:DNA mismatch repair endonuclease MutL [Wolbachia endosymbiont of Pentalonia nigronervosa]|uniref:DNA mismatch repair endonuclease MutL n=1 Tax=Wolbachia endosymbiont of Pentalonia nigronervosa TaxID=1301914 RepID=UPI00165F5366|nr:DNA mismatch repair endonuclease MutL [Wolbachia endosymbiont of Pentalonia nigronervosa]MBD0392056.1 DNA mismatch repair endonuclease MutL [Wolbachia endosymbiont of Pentalonia nigronervosa]